MQNDLNYRREYIFVVSIFIIFVFSFVLAYEKYYSLNYDLIVRVDCDPATEKCYFDEEESEYFNKVLISARDLKDLCFDLKSECMSEVLKKGIIQSCSADECVGIINE